MIRKIHIFLVIGRIPDDMFKKKTYKTQCQMQCRWTPTAKPLSFIMISFQMFVSFKIICFYNVAGDCVALCWAVSAKSTRRSASGALFVAASDSQNLTKPRMVSDTPLTEITQPSNI